MQLWFGTKKNVKSQTIDEVVGIINTLSNQ